jgi:hypothetical protein
MSNARHWVDEEKEVDVPISRGVAVELGILGVDDAGIKVSSGDDLADGNEGDEETKHPDGNGKDLVDVVTTDKRGDEERAEALERLIGRAEG